jgi:hypothetical protein
MTGQPIIEQLRGQPAREVNWPAYVMQPLKFTNLTKLKEMEERLFVLRGLIEIPSIS